MKRVLIYFVYDAQGIIDDYIFYAIDKMKPFSEHIIVVINGKLQDEYRNKLANGAVEIIVRKNIGFDVWAYKTAIDSIGWNELGKYDELILMNYTIMGPIYDLKNMFLEMDSRDIDFWGITKCFEETSPQTQKLWNNPYGYIPEHIQSSFCVFRKSLFESDDFHSLWDNMPMINSYYESGGTYEQVITKKFSDMGYKWDCYTDYGNIDCKNYGCCPLITAPLTVVKELRSPFFKRRSFFTSKFEFADVTPNIKEFWRFLVNETDYDTDMVLKNFIRCCNQRDIIEALLLLHPVRDNCLERQSPISTEKSHINLAIFVNIESVVDVDILKDTLTQHEPSCHVFYSSQSSLDINTLCTGVSASYTNYDYVVLVNPAEFVNEHELFVNYSNCQKYYIYGLLGNKGLLQSAIDLMERDGSIGLLTLPMDFLRSENWEQYDNWEKYYNITKEWAKKYNLNVPLDISKTPVLSHGVCVIRTKALKGMNSMKFSCFESDFIDIALALVCQHNGFLPQYIVPEYYMINNYFGYETYSNWMPKAVEVKSEYYRQTIKYRRETIKYYEDMSKSLQGTVTVLQNTNTALEARCSEFLQKINGREQSHAWKITSLQKTNAALEARCSELLQKIKELEQSHSWKITSPLRKIRSAFSPSGKNE